ncbi:transposase [Streptomyces sp. NPDC087843]|uniref:transposase n=1 Tax=Streptomyces sp. NPDC087843 TaxID=3365804 RepID=UPI0037F5F998
MKTEDQTAAAGHSTEPGRWQETFEVLMGRIAGRFVRVEPRRRTRAFVLALADTVGFATKPALAARMIGRALDAGVPASWVAGDELYGGNPHLGTALEQRQIGYVLAVTRDHQIATYAGKFRAYTLRRTTPADSVPEGPSAVAQRRLKRSERATPIQPRPRKPPSRQAR